MTKIINSLLFRATKSTLLWVLLCICLGLPIFNALMIFGASGLLEGLGLSGSDLFDTLGLVGEVATISSDCMILIVVAVALFFGSEFSNGTIRNAILSNKSRAQIFFAYTIVAGIFAFLFVTVYAAFSTLVYGLVLGFGNYVGSEIATSIFTSWGLGLLSGILMALVTLLFVFATKSKALSIFLPILIQAIPSVLLLLVTIGVTYGKLSEDAAGWIPLVNYSFYSGAVQDGLLALKLTVTTVTLAAGFGVGGFFIMQNTDLK